MQRPFAEALGLAEIIHGRRGARNRYRLTYLSVAKQEPTDEWRAVTTMEDASRRLDAVKKPRSQSLWFKGAQLAQVVPLS